MAAAPVELWSTRLSCPQIHGRISSLPQQLPSATLGEPENPSLNSDPGCIKVVDTYRPAAPRIVEQAFQLLENHFGSRVSYPTLFVDCPNSNRRIGAKKICDLRKHMLIAGGHVETPSRNTVAGLQPSDLTRHR